MKQNENFDNKELLEIKNPLIDIHTHVIFDVDDGAVSLEMSLDMLNAMIKQGVSDVILTPHIHSSVTKTSRRQQIINYNILKEAAKDLPINLYLGAEVRYRKHLNTIFENYTLNNTNYILIEFNPYEEEPIIEVLERISNKGLIPILAHCERYFYLKLEDYYSLKKMGVLLQVNANATLGLSKKFEFELINKLLDLKLIDFIATDTHRSNHRPPNLGKCYEFLENKYDKEYLREIFNSNALKILNK